MAQTTVAIALAEMRAILRDSATAPGFLDSEGLIMLNIAHTWWHENMERRAYSAVSGGNSAFEFFDSATSKSTYEAGAYYRWLDAETNAKGEMAEIIELHLIEAATNEAIVLQRLPWAELRKRQHDNAVPAQPTHWAGLKIMGTTTVATATEGGERWAIALYPLANWSDDPTNTVEWTVSGVVRHQPLVLTLVTDKIGLGDSEVGAVVNIASALMAPRLGRKALGDHLWTMMPRIVQDKMATTWTRDEVKA